MLPTFPCQGWGDWPYVIAYKRAIDQLRDDPIQMICLLPGGTIPDDLFETTRTEAEREGVDLHIWGRRDLPSYAADPYVIARLLATDAADVKPADVAVQLEANRRHSPETTRGHT